MDHVIEAVLAVGLLWVNVSHWRLRRQVKRLAVVTGSIGMSVGRLAQFVAARNPKVNEPVAEAHEVAKDLAKKPGRALLREVLKRHTKRA